MRDTEAIIMRTVILVRSLLTVLLLTLLGTAALRPAAASPAVVETHVPFSSTTFTSCTGEAIAFEGFLHFKVHVDTTTSGTTHSSVELNWQDVKGVGLLSGASYVLIEQISSSVNASGPFPAELNFEASAHFMRQGEDGTLVLGDDLHIKAFAHLTVNANGIVTVNRFGQTIECR
jgi:hypothetical protein